MFQKQCIVCGDYFTTRRCHAKTCGDACRARLSRHKKRLSRWADEAMDYVYALATERAQGHFSDEAARNLNRIAAYVDEIMLI